MEIERIHNCEYPSWRVIYKDKVYCRDERNNTHYWTIENIGQNRELYNIQNELEIIFHKTIRKNKIININKPQ
jgi:hypothetical protein